MKTLKILWKKELYFLMKFISWARNATSSITFLIFNNFLRSIAAMLPFHRNVQKLIFSSRSFFFKIVKEEGTHLFAKGERVQS